MIDSYSFGRIVIDGRRYDSDIVIYPDRIDSKWWRRDGHLLQVADLEEALKLSPEVLIVGTGEGGVMRVPEETRRHVENLGIELVAERTGEAVKTYNRVAPARRVVAALHLTC
jgi:hypothetical protein